MRPEAQSYLDKARQSLAHARAILEIDLGDEAGRFLSERYKLKAIADYEVGPEAVVPLQDAAAAIVTAARFVEIVGELMDRDL